MQFLSIPHHVWSFVEGGVRAIERVNIVGEKRVPIEPGSPYL